MAAVRTLLVGMSTMFSDIVVQALNRHTSLEIVAQLKHGEEFEVKWGRRAPDLVLRGLRSDECEKEVGAELLKLFPTATVIVFSTDSRHAFLHRMQPVRIPLNDISLERFIHAIVNNPVLRNGSNAPP